MNETIDIITLIRDHPLTKLSNDDHSSKILEKIKNKFTNDEQNMFVANFYCYLNYNTRLDFVVDLDKVWKWIGFSQKIRAKELLINNFTENVDYIVKYKDNINDNLAFSQEKARLHGGHNIEGIFITIHCFKKLCLKAKTKKSDEIHEYYVSLEEIMNEVVSEQAHDLKIKLTLKDHEISIIREKTLIESLKNRQVVYLAKVDTNIIKFGYTNDIKARVSGHKCSGWKEFNLLHVIESVNSKQIENMIKKNLKEHIISRKDECDETHIGLIQLSDKLTINKLYKEIMKYKESFENGEVMEQILLENEKLKNELEKMKNDYEKLKICLEKIQIPKEVNNPKLESKRYFLEFLKFFISDKHEQCIIQNENLYEEYKIYTNKIPNYSTLHIDSYKTFCNKTVECPYIINTRIQMDLDDIKYIPGKDNRLACKKIDIKLANEWIINEEVLMSSEIERITKIEDKSKNIDQKGNPEKYFRLFFENFLNTAKTDTITIDSDELLDLYKMFLNANKSHTADMYLDATFNREISKCMFVLNKRVDIGNRKDGDRRRVTVRIIDIKLLKKWLE